MNLDDLKAALGIDNATIRDGQITISANILTPNLNTLLVYCYDNQPIVISSAEFVSEDAGAQLLVVRGVGNFLQVPNLPVEAHVSLDMQGQAQLFLKYTLLSDRPGPNDWIFSRSFPQMPQVVDHNQPTMLDRTTGSVSQTLVAPLDQLVLFDAYYVVVSAPQQEPDFQVALQWGINFVSYLRPQGLLGIVENLFQYQNQLTVYGTIRKPLPTETPAALAGQYPASLASPRFPWQITADFPQGLPGILLQIGLGLDYHVIANQLEFRAEKLYLYTPLTVDWVLPGTNPPFIPLQAYSGQLTLTGADITVDLLAPMEIGVDALALFGYFEGVSLNNLAQLAGLTGSSASPLEQLPDQIKNLGQDLGKLELRSAQIAIEASDLRGVGVNSTAFTIGMPDLHWRLWDNHWEVRDIYCRFEIAYPFDGDDDPDSPVAREVGVTVYGTMEIEGIPFTVYASNQDGFTVYAEMTTAQTIPLKQLLQTYAPDLPTPGDLTINVLRVEVAAFDYYAMALALANEPTPWAIELGPQSLTVSDVLLSFTYPKGGPVAGSFGGNVAFGDAILRLRCDIPGHLVLRGELAEITLSQLSAQFDQAGFVLPPGFDLDLRQSSVLIEQQGDNLVFNAATDVENLGLLAFTAQKQGQWGVAAGMDLPGGLATIPGIGSTLAVFDSFVGLDKLLLVVSSLDQPGFQFPDTADFTAPRLGQGQIRLPAQAGGLARGMNLYAQLSLAKSQGFQALARYLGIALDGSIGVTLAVSLPEPTTNSKLFIAVNAEIQQGTTLMGEFGGLLQGGEVGAFLIADVKTLVQGQPLEFAVVALVLENGVLITGTMVGTVRFDPLPVALSNLALVIGLDWEGLPSLGLAATLDVANIESSLALFFDSTDPAKSVVAGAIPTLTLLDVAQVLAGQSNVPAGLDEVLGQIGLKELHAFNLPAATAPALDNRDLGAIASAFQQAANVKIPGSSDSVLLVRNQPGSVWHLTDLTTLQHYSLRHQDEAIVVSLEPQFYCAPQLTYIGALQFPQAFRIISAIDFLVLHTQITVIISPSQGIAAEVDIDPLVIYKPDFFAVHGAAGPDAPARLSLATHDQPDQTDPQLRAPHFLVSGTLHLLGVDVLNVYLLVSKQGLVFQIAAQVTPLVHAELQGNFSSLTALSVGGTMTVGIDRNLDLGALGTLTLNTQVQGTLDLGYTGGVAHATFTGSFTFQGLQSSLPPTTLNVDGPALANLADTVWDQVQDIITKLLADSTRWLTWVGDHTIQEAGQTPGQVGQVLSSMYHLSSNEIATQTHQILGYGSTEIAGALQGAGVAGDEAARILASMNYPVTEIITAIGSVFTGHTDVSVGHLDTPAGPHVDTQTPPHGDTPQHVDTPAGPHVDTQTPPHGDTQQHVDTPAGPHVDTQTPPHGDTQQHVDTPAGPHVDTPEQMHVDTPEAPHADVPGAHTDFRTFGHHTDTHVTPHVDTQAYPHSDVGGSPHIDTQTPPHGDTPQHADTPAGPHADTQTPPHGDTPQHADTPAGPHADAPTPPHGDTSQHVDTPAGPHVDTQTPPHGDTPQHVDTPAGP